MNDVKLLGIYLNDHLAGSVGGIELTKRILGENEGNEYGRFLSDLLAEIESDQQTLKDLMKRLEISESLPKQGAAWMAEKAGRFKLNGRLAGYSPLSRLVELESLALGVEGKLAMWRSLDHVSSGEESLTPFDFPALMERAKAQLDRIERYRLEAAAQALAVS